MRSIHFPGSARTHRVASTRHPWGARACLGLLLLLPHLATPAADSPPPPAAGPLPLDALVAEAVARNPELGFYEAEITAARAGVRTARAWRNPEITGTVGRNETRTGGVEAEGVAWTVSIQQPFEWPGRISLRKAIANQDLELAKLGCDRFKAALAGRVCTLAYSLFAARQRAEAATEVAGRFTALREVLVQRDPAGLTPLLETRVIEATELNALRKAGEAQLIAEAALLELNQLRGAPAESPLQVAETPMSFQPAEDRESLLARARTQNFELRARAVELAQQGFRVDLARHERFPALAVGPMVSEEVAGGDRQTIAGVVVSLPLPLWNRHRGDIDAAAARQTQAAVSYEVARRDVERRVLEAALVYETKRREMTRWRPDSVAHFREAAEVADRHYRLGAVPISTYVELQKQYLEAVESLLDTRREALEAAVRLELLTGLPQPVALGLPSRETP